MSLAFKMKSDFKENFFSALLLPCIITYLMKTSSMVVMEIPKLAIPSSSCLSVISVSRSLNLGEEGEGASTWKVIFTLIFLLHIGGICSLFFVAMLIIFSMDGDKSRMWNIPRIYTYETITTKAIDIPIVSHNFLPSLLLFFIFVVKMHNLRAILWVNIKYVIWLYVGTMLYSWSPKFIYLA